MYHSQKTDTPGTDVIQGLMQQGGVCGLLVELVSRTKAGPGEAGSPAGGCCTGQSTPAAMAM